MSTERLICDEKVEECCSQDNVNKDEDVRATLHGTETHCCGSHKPEQVPVSNTSNYNASDVSVTTTRLRVQGICCGQEAELVKTLLIPLEGVVSVSVNVVARTAVVRHDEKLLLSSDLVKILNDYHLGVSILQSGTAVSDRGKTTFFTSHTTAISLLLLVLCLFSVVIFANFYNQQWKIWVTVTLIVIASLPILKRAFNSWRKGIFLDVNILMLVAICGVAALKQWVEGATLVTVFYIADLLQSYCFYRVEEAVSKLAVESPLKAVCAVTKEPIDLDRVVPGTLLAICEGDKIPLDGIVTKGTGSVDECLITGEATPITKKKGDFTYSGTILQSGYLEIETTSTFENSTMAQITKMVQVSQGNATQAEATVNKFAKFYTPLVLLLAAAVFSIPLIIDVSENGSVDKKSFTIWTKRALMVLLVACPCALLMCIPIPVISCIVAAAKNGVLVKGGATVEALAFVKTVLFDKTGTLSEGKLRVNDVESYSDLLKAKDAMKEFMEIIAALEKKSNHPAATALVNFFFGCLAQYHSNNTEEVSTLPEVSKFENLPGLGIRGTVGDRDVLIGNLDLMKLFDVPCKKCNEDVLEWAGKGTSAVLIAVDGEVCMAVGLSDRPRSTAAAAVHALKNQSIEVLMVTGDGNGPASSIAREVGIDRVFSSMKPEDKLQLINTAKDKRKSPKDAIAMVGDGINDVPSLVASDVGIAVATSGVAITLESSDVVLINDNISKISSIILLSKRVHSICYQNVMLAIGIKAVTMIVIFSTQSGLWIAVLSDLLALITVVLNGLRPLIWRDKHGNWI